ncbi:hypothetical protein GH733_015824 [Mirounga leonina]|nr:hypothetical protein GH733_015824 [Mirounga leonina]
MPGLHEIRSDPEVLTARQCPEVMVAFQDVAQNPAKTSKYQTNSKSWSKCETVFISKMGTSTVHAWDTKGFALLGSFRSMITSPGVLVVSFFLTSNSVG